MSVSTSRGEPAHGAAPNNGDGAATLKEPSAEDQLIDRILMELARVGIAAPLGSMFSGLGSSVQQMADNKEALQEALMPFFFGSGSQRFQLAVSAKDGLALGQEANLDALGPGEMEANVVFEDDDVDLRRNKSVRALNLAGDFRFGGFTDIRFIETLARAVFRQIGLAQGPDIGSQALAAALRKGLPAVHKMLSEIFFAEESDVHVTYIENETSSGGSSPRAIRLEFTGIISIKKLRRKYSSLENIVQHLNHLCFSVLETKADHHQMSESEMETYAADAPSLVNLSLDHQGGHRCAITLVSCVLEDSNALVWFNQETLLPRKNDDGSFAVAPFDMAKVNTFFIRTRIQVRVPELGCATFKLPELVFELANCLSVNGGREEMFRLSLAYMSGHHRLTALAMRPFVNLDNFRAVLTRDLRIDIGWKPVESDDQDEAKDTAGSHLGNFDLQFQFRLVPPRTMVTRCLSFFIKTQLSRFEVLDFLSDLCTAIGSDLTGLANRL